MAKYLTLWELNPAMVTANPKERAALWGPMVQMVKQEIKEGITKEWGTFAGEMKGFSVGEGDEMSVSISAQKYLPFVKFTVHQIVSIEQMEEIIKNLAK